MGLLADGRFYNGLSGARARFAPTARRRKDSALSSVSRAIRSAGSMAAVSGCVWLGYTSWEVTLKSSIISHEAKHDKKSE